MRRPHHNQQDLGATHGWITTVSSQPSTQKPLILNSDARKKSAGTDGGLIDTHSFMVDQRSGGGDGGGRLGAASQQLLAVREAFSGDNVVEEFEREKAELEAKELAKDAPVVLPGQILPCKLLSKLLCKLLGHIRFVEIYCAQ